MKIYKLKETVTGYKSGTLVTPVADLDTGMPTCMTLKKISTDYHKRDFIHVRWEYMELVDEVEWHYTAR